MKTNTEYKYKVVSIEDPSKEDYILRPESSKIWEKKFLTLEEALRCYESFTDWGFADLTKVVAILDSNGNRLVSKEFHRPISYA
jgi:hypothetical protein